MGLLGWSRQALLAALALSLCLGCEVAQAPPPDAGLPWYRHVSVVLDIPYGDQPAQRLDVFRQGYLGENPPVLQHSSDPRFTLLYFHGGGWIEGEKGLDRKFVPFLQAGWHVITAEYRRGPNTAPAAVDDALCALRWVVEASDDFGFDPDRIVVAGESAGGHLALVTGILGSRPGHHCVPDGGLIVAGVVNWFGITDIEAVEAFLARSVPDGNYARAWVGDLSRMSSISAEYSPVQIVDSLSPPVITIHGDADPLVPYEQATSFHDLLTELGVPNRLETVPGGRHGGFGDAEFQRLFESIFLFLAQNGVSPAPGPPPAPVQRH